MVFGVELVPIFFGNSTEAAAGVNVSSSGWCPGAAGESQAVSAYLTQTCAQ